MQNRAARRAKTLASYLLLTLVTFCLIIPLVWMVSASFQGPGEIYKIPFNWVPKTFRFENYATAWEYGNMRHALTSSISISLIYIVCHVSFCTLIGYVFAKYQFRWKKTLFMLILLTMMIPQELTFFPVYGVTRSLGLVDQYVGVVLPFVISGFGIFFMRQFCAYVPNEIIEAARIDGCGHFKTFFRIGVPLLRPAISALTVLAFSFIWDEFAWSKLVLNSPQKMSIPIMLSSFASAPTNEVRMPELLAASVICMLPVVILFFLFQRQFIASITQSGVKG